MQKTLVIGANGQIGQLFCRIAADKNLPVKAMVRNKSQTEFFSSLDIETVIGDLEADFEHCFDDCNRVIFTAGSGGHTGADKTLMIDLYGAVRAIDLSVTKDIQHFIMVSALRAELPLSAPEKLRPYMVAKLMADKYLVDSKLPATILRPGRLTDEPATQKVRIPEPRDRDPITISRENVAYYLAECLANNSCIGKTIDLLDGDSPISHTF